MVFKSHDENLLHADQVGSVRIRAKRFEIPSVFTVRDGLGVTYL